MDEIFGLKETEVDTEVEIAVADERAPLLDHAHV